MLPSKLAPQNRPKSNDNRCQGAFHLVLGFVIDFRSIFLRNLDAPIMKNRAPAAARARFLRNRHSKLTSIFDPMLVPTWLHFGIQIPPISDQKSIPRGTKNDRFLDRFFVEVGSNLGPKLGPKSRSRRAQNAPKTLPRRHQDSPRATRAPKIEI